MNSHVTDIFKNVAPVVRNILNIQTLLCS